MPRWWGRTVVLHDAEAHDDDARTANGTGHAASSTTTTTTAAIDAGSWQGCLPATRASPATPRCWGARNAASAAPTTAVAQAAARDGTQGRRTTDGTLIADGGISTRTPRSATASTRCIQVAWRAAARVPQAGCRLRRCASSARDRLEEPRSATASTGLSVRCTASASTTAFRRGVQAETRVASAVRGRGRVPSHA